MRLQTVWTTSLRVAMPSDRISDAVRTRLDSISAHLDSHRTCPAKPRVDGIDAGIGGQKGFDSAFLLHISLRFCEEFLRHPRDTGSGFKDDPRHDE